MHVVVDPGTVFLTVADHRDLNIGSTDTDRRGTGAELHIIAVLLGNLSADGTDSPLQDRGLLLIGRLLFIDQLLQQHLGVGTDDHLALVDHADEYLVFLAGHNTVTCLYLELLLCLQCLRASVNLDVPFRLQDGPYLSRKQCPRERDQGRKKYRAYPSQHDNTPILL